MWSSGIKWKTKEVEDMIQIVKGVVLTEAALALIQGKEDELSPQDELKSDVTQLGVLEDDGTRKLAMILCSEKKRLIAEAAELLRGRIDGSLTGDDVVNTAKRLHKEKTKLEEAESLFFSLLKESLPADCAISDYGAVGVAKGWVIYGVKATYSKMFGQILGYDVEIVHL